MTVLRLAALAVLGLVTSAAAQTGTPPTHLDDTHGTLSDKLGETDGVIRPKGDVDPDMHKATPQNGAMPVIKPGQVPSQSGNGATGTGKEGLY